MRRLLASFAIITLLLWAALPERGCAEDGVQIVCLLRAKSVYWQNVKRGIDKEAEAVGADVTYLYVSGQENVLNRASAVEIAVLSGADVILTTYSVDEGFAESLLDAREKGSIVIFMDTDGPTDLRDYYVGIDHLAAGRELARVMLGMLAPGEHALLCMSPVFSEYQSQALLEQGIKEVFTESECMLDSFSDVLNVDYERQTELDQYIRAHPEVHGVFSLSQLQTRGYAQLLEGADWKDRVHVVGLDYQEVIRPYIEDGSILAILDKNSEHLGVVCVQTALAIAEGAPPPGDRVLIDYRVLDKENLQSYLDGEAGQ